MLEQEIFYKVVTHLLTQNKRSEGADNVCMYRNPDGLMCAVGVLIPDDVYDSGMEGICFPSVLNSWDKLDFLRDASYLLADLQVIHDGSPVNEWPSELNLLAKDFGLNVPQILKDRLSNEIL